MTLEGLFEKEKAEKTNISHLFIVFIQIKAVLNFVLKFMLLLYPFLGGGRGGNNE